MGKIEENLIKLYADPFDPQPIPLHLQVTNELSMCISDLICDDKKEDLTNIVPKLFAVSTRSNLKKDKSQMISTTIAIISITKPQESRNNAMTRMLMLMICKLSPLPHVQHVKRTTIIPTLGLFAHHSEKSS